MGKINVLITGAGSTMGYSVLKALMSSKYKERINLILTNSDSDGPAFFLKPLAHKCYIVPIAKDPTYIPTMLEICKENEIHILFSGTEHEIFELSKNSDKFLSNSNTVVMLSDLNVINIGTDKLKTYEFFVENGLPFPETVLFDDYQKLIDEVGFPILMKPRIASASRNIFIVNSVDELIQKQFAPSDQIILQRYLDSDIEYTVETFMDKSGRICGTIPMKRELNFGLSVSGKIDRNIDVIKVSEDVTHALKPMGPVNVQLRVVNGEPIPFEINTRFSSTECVRAHYGFNSVEASISNFLFNEEITLEYREGMFMRYWDECYFESDEYEKLVANGYLIR
ncbi:ATP-grasp domain-containing protein [Paenibacillus qinlingensis]|uniref:Carbamoyl-phosphate synthase large subunit n=1 Tax=Paenibacillus qinlingensis TaxID=1837343 RepID=A0ABU1NXJ5_9BACL|nr:ATP-grasp domain-containing protein [Paenibacillus qinlingensis]MDR6552206.1 carbamoyl-phosphate synthase large subunit [Paenibacillus qinlingensis]